MQNMGTENRNDDLIMYILYLCFLRHALYLNLFHIIKQLEIGFEDKLDLISNSITQILW